MRPYFLWDYDLSDKKVRHILKSGNETSRIWLVSRILESAKYEDVWRYVDLAEVKRMFPRLKLKEPIRRAWAHALAVWSDKNDS